MIRKNNAAESTKLTAALNIILLIVLITSRLPFYTLGKTQKTHLQLLASAHIYW